MSFQILKDKLQKCIDSWSVCYLSQGGSEVFIRSILQVIPTYPMICFLLLKSLCIDIEEIMTNFLWQKSLEKTGIRWCT